ncbi:putative Pentatricopeptide repeat-containing protein, mitochondrial [Cocos nucifera]|uniref:Putative Pentatricopeptide repeat-containing protein, mitochondrial n=1 Tax=Cocos nucifera TaxID=13894 RepID=A0A8K0N4M2_COCNU|nr:putative Pentatricopeptide repeat-containing protein, mitochondrial [Cocos nucifera]
MVESGWKPNAVAYNIMISWYCRNDRVACALKLLDAMLRPFGYSAIETLEQQSELIFDEKIRGVVPSITTYSIVINAYCKHGDIDLAFGGSNQMVEQGCKAYYCYL